MRPSDNRAFKEWASVCRALGEGRQILILRKGGIAEGPRGFEVTDREFFLYPTYLHQSPTGVIPEWRAVFEACVDPAPGRVSISHYATVSSWARIRTIETLRALQGQHVWADAVVGERFRRWADESVHVLMLRVYALPQAVVLPALGSYAGCKSWLSLVEQVPLDGVVPVLDDSVFQSKLEAIRKIVG
jgi:hypothetical protein